MSESTRAPATDAQEAVNLARLGEAYAPPAVADSSPEVSEVIATLPWWAARGLIYLTLGFIVMAFIWAALSQVDVVVESRGTLVPEGNVKEVQAAGGGAVLNVFAREGDTVERGQALVQLDATEMRARLDKLREELATSKTQLRQLMVKAPVAETLEQRNRIARLESEVTAAEQGLRQTTISAPVAGVITRLHVNGAGAVVAGGQAVATIAPPARLVAEARVLNRDIARIDRGMAVKLKFDAFPFQDYGTLDGTIIDIAPDARVDKDGQSYYKVVVALERTEMVLKGRRVALRPGLALSAEIVTGRKSVLSFILEPFSETNEGAGGTA